MRACASLLLLLLLGGCAVSGLFPDWVSEDTAGPQPFNYRFIIANGLSAILGPREEPNRVLEISTPQRVDANRGATWMVCLKVLRSPEPTPRAYYAVFIQREKMIDSRLSVVLDRCESEPYSPFDWKADADNPVPLR